MSCVTGLYYLLAIYQLSVETLGSLVVPSLGSDHNSSALMSVSVFLQTFKAFGHFIFNLIMHMRVRTLKHKLSRTLFLPKYQFSIYKNLTKIQFVSFHMIQLARHVFQLFHSSSYIYTPTKVGVTSLWREEGKFNVFRHLSLSVALFISWACSPPSLNSHFSIYLYIIMCTSLQCGGWFRLLNNYFPCHPLARMMPMALHFLVVIFISCLPPMIPAQGKQNLCFDSSCSVIQFTTRKILTLQKLVNHSSSQASKPGLVMGKLIGDTRMARGYRPDITSQSYVCAWMATGWSWRIT